MMTATLISAGNRVEHAEYGAGIVLFVQENRDDFGRPLGTYFAGVLFDDHDAWLLPEVDTLEVVGTSQLPADVPTYATLDAYAPARPKSRHGIRPATLFHFRIEGEGPFLIEDGQSVPCLPCHRCKGWGEYSYNQHDGSVCYGCYGTGTGKAITWDDALRIAKRRKADKERAERARFAELWDTAHAWDVFRAENVDVIAFLTGKNDRSGFIGDMARKVADLTPLSERMLSALRRTMGEQAAKSATRQAAGHVGTVGERETFEVRIMVTRDIETQFGYSTLVIMETREGASLKTFGSGEWARNAEANPDVWVSIKATVKAHEEYQGQPQTMLSRVAAA